jgi:hypothetical protein
MAEHSEKILKGDHAFIEAEMYEEDEVTPVQATSATMIYRDPNGIEQTIGPITINPPSGIVSMPLLPINTQESGRYVGKVTFTLPGGILKSITKTWEVFDPLEISVTEADHTIDIVWMMIEDTFDSKEGGPYLTDSSFFDQNKIAVLFDAALMRINARPPIQNFDVDTFPYSSARPLLVKALYIEVVKHLIRSYVEQPAVVASNVPYFDRRDYVQRWQTIVDKEELELERWIKLFKRGFYNFGSGALLVDLKSGRRLNYFRNPARGRWW